MFHKDDCIRSRQIKTQASHMCCKEKNINWWIIVKSVKRGKQERVGCNKNNDNNPLLFPWNYSHTAFTLFKDPTLSLQNIYFIMGGKFSFKGNLNILRSWSCHCLSLQNICFIIGGKVFLQWQCGMRNFLVWWYTGVGPIFLVMGTTVFTHAIIQSYFTE